MDVSMPLVFADCQWRITRFETPEDGVTVLGLWHLWDSFNGCFQTWVMPVEYWAGEACEGEDEEDHFGWFKQLGYEMKDGVLTSNEEKSDAPPTFWCHMAFEDGDRSFRVGPSRAVTGAKKIIDGLAKSGAN